MATPDPIGTFHVDATGHLVRRGCPRSGKEYEQRCELRTLEEAAHTIDEMNGAAFTYREVHAAMSAAPGADWPLTPVAVAIGFLKERGIIVPVTGRRHVANGDAVHLDTMIEYHALREEPAPEAGEEH